MPLTKIQSLGITDGTIVNADINASAAITGTKISNLNDAKAWVNFNGTGTVAINASFNVTSITDNGTGDYTVNFTNALTDANYVLAGMGSDNTDAVLSLKAIDATSNPTLKSTTQVTIVTVQGGSTLADINNINLIVIR